MAGVGGFGGRILASGPDARVAIERLMEATACELTRDDRPIGCMISITLMHGSADAMPVRAELAKRRSSAQAKIRSVIQKDINSGRLPGDCDAGN
jgi:hypothetical protein